MAGINPQEMAQKAVNFAKDNGGKAINLINANRGPAAAAGATIVVAAIGLNMLRNRNKDGVPEQEADQNMAAAHTQLPPTRAQEAAASQGAPAMGM